MKKKKIIIVVTLVILFIIICGAYRFIYLQTRLPELHEEEADEENIPADPLKSPEVEQREAVSFDEKYTQVSGSYAVEGDAFSTFMYDIDEDGVTESGINVLNDEVGQVSRKEETEYFLSKGFKVKTIAELTADEVGEGQDSYRGLSHQSGW